MQTRSIRQNWHGHLGTQGTCLPENKQKHSSLFMTPSRISSNASHDTITCSSCHSHPFTLPFTWSVHYKSFQKYFSEGADLTRFLWAGSRAVCPDSSHVLMVFGVRGKKISLDQFRQRPKELHGRSGLGKRGQWACNKACPSSAPFCSLILQRWQPSLSYIPYCFSRFGQGLPGSR